MSEKLQSLNISFNKNTSTAKLNKTYETKLKETHPIHQYLKKLSKQILKDIASKIRIEYNNRHDRLRATIVKYFFSTHADSPLTSLKKCINAPAPEINQAEIDKTHPIFEFLKSIPDDLIKEYTKKLGKNNLRNYESMRSWIAKHFFAYDNTTPLESLKKFIIGELPDLHVTSKKEPTKQKSESRSGLSTKKTKTDLTAITENQEKLKNCRQTFLDSIPKKQS